MPDLNSVTLSGRLGSDPELRHTGGGTAVAEVSLAIGGRKPKEGGDARTDWVTLTIWGRSAEAFCDYMHKGRMVIVRGRLQEDRWESDGQKRTKLKVVVEDWFFAGDGQGNGGGGSRSSSSSSSGNGGGPAASDDLAPAGAPSGGGGGWDDDIPF